MNDSVFRNAIVQGVESEDYFGFASGKEGDRYLGFSFGRGSIATLDESSLLIDRETARAYADRLREEVQPKPKPETPDDGDKTDGVSDGASGQLVGGVENPSPTVSAKKRFYGTVNLDPVKAKMDFATIMDEVVQQFTSKLGVDVKISVEIEATCGDGFNESMQRTVRENCNVLGFNSPEFEDE